MSIKNYLFRNSNHNAYKTANEQAKAVPRIHEKYHIYTSVNFLICIEFILRNHFFSDGTTHHTINPSGISQNNGYKNNR